MRTLLILALVLASSFNTPPLANAETSCTAEDSSGKTITGVLVGGACSVAQPDGAYCSRNSTCQSGYCSLDYQFFTFLNKCATPPTLSSQTCRALGDTCSYQGNTGKCIAVQAGTDTVLSCDVAGGTTGLPTGSQTQTGQPIPTQTEQTRTGQPIPSRTSAGNGQNITLVNPLGAASCTSSGNCLMAFLESVLKFVIQVGAVIVVLMLVYVGYKFVVAQGKEAEIREARTMLLWTVVGALILLGAQAIASGIKATVQAIGG
jgi:hypothetical protein